MKHTARKQNPKPVQKIGTCGECAHGTFDWKFENLSLEGKPTLVKCPYKPYKQVVSEKGCNLFRPKV